MTATMHEVTLEHPEDSVLIHLSDGRRVVVSTESWDHDWVRLELRDENGMLDHVDQVAFKYGKARVR